MKKLNKTGPSTDPWGTPLVTSLQPDSAPLMTTLTDPLNSMSVFRVNRPAVHRSVQTPQRLSGRLKVLEERNRGEQAENERHSNMRVSLVNSFVKNVNLSKCWICVFLPKTVGQGFQPIGIAVPKAVNWNGCW